MVRYFLSFILKKQIFIIALYEAAEFMAIWYSSTTVMCSCTVTVAQDYCFPLNEGIEVLFSERQTMRHMPFSLYLKKSSFMPRKATVREAALNAHLLGINNLRRGINEDFGVRDWVVVV